jgi:hypothetical protein
MRRSAEAHAAECSQRIAVALKNLFRRFWNRQSQHGSPAIQAAKYNVWVESLPLRTFLLATSGPQHSFHPPLPIDRVEAIDVTKKIKRRI